MAATVQVAVALLSVRAGLDARIFQAAGYLVGTGHSPYVAVNLRQVFGDPLYATLPAIGYPPPWPLMLGGIYRVTYALHPDLALYNAAIKLPAIAASLGLAYLAAATLHNLGAKRMVVRRVWVALLFNPLVIFVGAVWGQIDAVVAFLALAALVLAAGERRDLSAVSLALAVCVKPTAAPLLLAALVFTGAVSAARALRYAVVFAVAAAVFYVLPFPILGWDGSPFRAANAQFSMAGGMSLVSFARPWTGPLTLDGHWWLLGMLWVPALAAAVLVARRGRGEVAGLTGLLALGVGLTLVFFLCRTWLSEPNVLLVLAPVLLLGALGRVPRRLFTALWVVTLAFAVANASPVQLLWTFSPATTEAVLTAVRDHPQVTLSIRAALALAWQLTGWWTVAACLRGPRSARLSAPDGAGRASATVAAPAATGREVAP